MSKLNDNSITIYDAMMNIQKGRYVMPAFQRQFEWDMSRIEKLWDSILLDYPISTFLFWKVDQNNITADTYFCEFIHKIQFDSRKMPDDVNFKTITIDTNITDIAILDGQQRLTSLFITLFGDTVIRPKNARKSSGNCIVTKLLIELDKNRVEIDEEYNNKKYDISFTTKVGKLSPTQFELKNILNDNFKDISKRENAIEQATRFVSSNSKDYAKEILRKLCKKIYEERLIRYTEIIDMNQDDALEMFIRFNNGGKRLLKSEITMSIFEAYWPRSRTQIGKLLSDKYQKFGTDFIVRTALMLYGDVIKSTINKKVAENLKNEWDNFKDMLHKLECLLTSWKIDISRFANSWNVLIPLAYSIYYNPEYMENEKPMKAYLIRAILFGYFRSGTTSKLQQMKSNINHFDFSITYEMLDQIYELKVTNYKIEDIVLAEKGSRVAGEVLYYLGINWIKDLPYEQDHLHPTARFDESKPIKVSFEDWRNWRSMRNQLPNVHLLYGRENASKGEMSLLDYYNEMDVNEQEKFNQKAFIPQDVSLSIDEFGAFFEKRKKILIDKIKELLS